MKCRNPISRAVAYLFFLPFLGVQDCAAKSQWQIIPASADRPCFAYAKAEAAVRSDDKAANFGTYVVSSRSSKTEQQFRKAYRDGDGAYDFAVSAPDAELVSASMTVGNLRAELVPQRGNAFFGSYAMQKKFVAALMTEGFAHIRARDVHGVTYQGTILSDGLEKAMPPARKACK